MALGPRISKFGGTAGNIRGLSPGPPSLGVPQGIDEACPWVLLVQGHSHEEKEPALEAPTLWFGGRHRSALDTSSFGESRRKMTAALRSSQCGAQGVERGPPFGTS